jgi:hypothetical protein
MIKEFLFNSIFGSLGRLSSGVQKKIYPIEQLKKDIKIGIRCSNPISFNHTQKIPLASIYFEIINMSQYLSLTLDRLVFELWLDLRLKSGPEFQPFLRNNQVRKKEISVKGIEEVYCEVELDDSQLRKLKQVQKREKQQTATIYLTAYFSSRLYEVIIQEDLKNIPYKIELPYHSQAFTVSR